MSDFYLKVGDTSPALLYDIGVNLTGAKSLTFSATDVDTGVKVINAAAASAVGDPTEGVLRYQWAAPDTAAARRLNANFRVVYGDDQIETFPNQGHIAITVETAG